MLGITRYHRVVSHIGKKSESIDELKKNLKIAGQKLESLELIRFIFIILLYSSVVSGIFSIFPEFQPFIKQILKFSGIIGSTFCLIIIAITSRYIGLYTIDLQLIATKIIAKNELQRTKLRNKKE